MFLRVGVGKARQRGVIQYFIGLSFALNDFFLFQLGQGADYGFKGKARYFRYLGAFQAVYCGRSGVLRPHPFPGSQPA